MESPDYTSLLNPNISLPSFELFSDHDLTVKTSLYHQLCNCSLKSPHLNLATYNSIPNSLYDLISGLYKYSKVLIFTSKPINFNHDLEISIYTESSYDVTHWSSIMNEDYYWDLIVSIDIIPNPDKVLPIPLKNKYRLWVDFENCDFIDILDISALYINYNNSLYIVSTFIPTWFIYAKILQVDTIVRQITIPVSKLYSEDTCPICYEFTNSKNSIIGKCGHIVCNKCFIKCKSKTCCICKRKNSFDVKCIKKINPESLHILILKIIEYYQNIHALKFYIIFKSEIAMNRFKLSSGMREDQNLYQIDFLNNINKSNLKRNVVIAVDLYHFFIDSCVLIRIEME